MKLAILGYGAEGKSVEKYFKSHPYDNISPKDIDITVFDDFKDEDIDKLGLDKFDVIFRSPSVRPHYDFNAHDKDDIFNEKAYLNHKPYWTSATKYFFEHCHAEIISVTGTKGKGTTCSMIKALLGSITNSISTKSASTRPKNFLVGNIGIPPLDVLDQITEHDNVVFEMSSFQLWDFHANSAVSVILRIEPDHLNVHKDFDEYVYAKAALARYKTKDDYLVYYRDNPITKKVAEQSAAHLLPYPISTLTDSADNSAYALSTIALDHLQKLLDALVVPGEHNRENAEAAIVATAARYFGGNVESLLTSEFYEPMLSAMHQFTGLPHRCEFLRELNHVKYYDDNYCTALPSLDVALKAFPNSPIILIAGGYSKGTDEEVKKRIFETSNLEKVILIGSTAKALAEGISPKLYEIATNLEDAVNKARTTAEKVAKNSKTSAIVLMSPGFASFDMFKNATDRGEQFTKIVNSLT